jgi:outer membrane protein, multidrug efflux system
LVLEDVENAVVSYTRSQERDVQLQFAAKDSKRAADLVIIRFTNGATALLDLLDAEDAYAENHSDNGLSAVFTVQIACGRVRPTTVIWGRRARANVPVSIPWPI